MKIRNIAVLVLPLLMLAACSFDKQRIDYKSGVSQVPPLEIPPDLTEITANEQYVIPGTDGLSVTNFSDYSKGVAGQPGTGNTGVLPVLANRHLERDGMQHWIVVEDKAENVWPVIKAFWLKLGFKIPMENLQAGVMQTNWLENQGNVPKSYVRHIQGNGKAVDLLQSEGVRDQYVTRIERSKDGLSTEIHITLQEMQEMLSGNGRQVKWLPHDRDPEIEVAMLQMLMDKMGSLPNPVSPDATNAASAVAPTAEPVAAVSVQLKEAAAGKIIQINEPFDRSWHRVGLALDAAHIVTTDKDRSKGIYFVSAMQDKDKQDSKKQAVDYLVTVRESHDGSEITVTDQNGKSDAEAVRLLDALYQSLKNPSAGTRPATEEKANTSSGDAIRPAR